MVRHSIAATLSVGAVLASLVVAPLPAAAQSKGISGLFGCEGSGKKQEGGALIGAAAGALVGRAVSKNEKTLGTVLGAAAGAAAGAYIGCRMQSTDQAMAQQATKRALDSGRSESWSNSRTGASGRIDVVSSSYGPPISGETLRFERGVQALRSYDAVGGDYTARGTANLRSGPAGGPRRLRRRLCLGPAAEPERLRSGSQLPDHQRLDQHPQRPPDHRALQRLQGRPRRVAADGGVAMV
jgi:surface antigen